MSRARRFYRFLRPEERKRLFTRLEAHMGREVHPELDASRCARELRTRPAVVRRCLLGQPVSARAAGRVLRSAA